MLGGLGGTIREPRRGAATALHCGADLLRADISAAVGFARVRARRALGLQRRAAGIDRRSFCPVAARHDVFDFIGGLLPFPLCRLGAPLAFCLYFFFAYCSDPPSPPTC